MKKKSLGRGMDAVFLDNTLEESQGAVSTLRISDIEPRKAQPRKKFDTEALSELADSISANGIIQPIAVRKLDSGFYQIIAGERRWRAAKMAGLNEVPVVIVEADDKVASELALVENIQREDLNPIEEAEAYKALIDEYGYTQEQVAVRVGKSRSTVTNSMRILALPKAVLDMVANETLSFGHARTLLGLNDKKKTEEAAKTIVSKDLSVRDTEILVKKLNSPSKDLPKKDDAVEKAYYKSLEGKIKKSIGYQVKIAHSDKKKSITISYKTTDELENIIRTLVGDNNADKIFN